jgi:hypothetical protein
VPSAPGRRIGGRFLLEESIASPVEAAELNARDTLDDERAV